MKELDGFDRIVTSSFTESELRSAFRREEIESVSEEVWSAITWVSPDRRLTEEIRQALGAGYLRGADAWHVATALYLEPTPRDLAFLTLDVRQRDIARELGFPVSNTRRP